MALDINPQDKTTGKENFQRVVGKLAAQDQQDAQRGVTRRRFMQGMLATGAALPVSAAAFYGYQNTRFRDRPVKAAIIGTGDEGGVLVGEHNPNYVQFVAYSDIRPSNRARIFEDEQRTNPASPRRGFKHHYGNECYLTIDWYEDYKELLRRSDIEMVVIALPLNLHAQVAIDALNAGKHVLCEKLMAHNITQCKAMIEAAKRNDKLLSIGHQRHYNLLYAHALEIVNSGVDGEPGVLGEIHHIRALWHRNNTRELPPNLRTADRRYSDSWRPEIKREDRELLGNRDLRPFGFKDLNQLVRWRLYHETGGGLMAELGSHQLDACSIFLGKEKPLAVTAVGGKHFFTDDRECEDHVYCTYEFPGRTYWADKTRRQVGNPHDIVVVTYSSICTNGFEPYGECVMGTKGTLIVEEEKNAYLFAAQGSRGVEMTATTSPAGRAALDASASTAPVERQAQATGQAALGSGVPSRGYREEMEHLAYCIRMREQASAADRAALQPRCPGKNAMADAIIALTANKAMRERRRIEFRDAWFDPDSPEVPENA